MTDTNRLPAIEALGEAELCALRRLKDGWVTGTWHVEMAIRTNVKHVTMQQVRRLLRKLSTAGLVEPVPYKSSRNYHWRITDAGRLISARTLTPGPTVNAGERNLDAWNHIKPKQAPTP